LCLYLATLIDVYVFPKPRSSQRADFLRLMQKAIASRWCLKGSTWKANPAGKTIGAGPPLLLLPLLFPRTSVAASSVLSTRPSGSGEHLSLVCTGSTLSLVVSGTHPCRSASLIVFPALSVSASVGVTPLHPVCECVPVLTQLPSGQLIGLFVRVLERIPSSLPHPAHCTPGKFVPRVSCMPVLPVPTPVPKLRVSVPRTLLSVPSELASTEMLAADSALVLRVSALDPPRSSLVRSSFGSVLGLLDSALSASGIPFWSSSSLVALARSSVYHCLIGGLSLVGSIAAGSNCLRFRKVDIVAGIHQALAAPSHTAPFTIFLNDSRFS
jgi:hypothetical protein